MADERRDIHGEVRSARRENPGWRKGQAYFNVAHDIDPDWADNIRGTMDDPFYKDYRLPFFLTKWEMSH